MPKDAADVLQKLREIVQNGTLGDYQLDKSAAVCLVDIFTGQCLMVSSEMLTLATSVSLFTESQDMITQSPISPSAFESSQLALTSSLSMIADVSITPSSDISDTILPSLVSSEDFQSSSALVAAPLTVETSMKITNIDFNENLQNRTSQEYQDFQKAFCSNVSAALFLFHFLIF